MGAWHQLVDDLRRATFRRQLTVLVSLGVMLVCAASAGLSSWQGIQQARRTLVLQGLNLAESVAQQSQLALLTGGAENAHAAIDRAFSFPSVRRVELLDAQGRKLLARGAAPAQAASQPQGQAGGSYLEHESEEAWSFVAPVRSGTGEATPFAAEEQRPGELLGYVRLSQGKGELRDLVVRLLLWNFGAGLLLAVLLLAGLRTLSRRLTRPLGDLAGTMARARSGEMGLRAHLDGPRDIAQMAGAFNGMMEVLEQRDRQLQLQNEQLQQHAETLEQRVAERTGSLLVANSELQRALDHLGEAQKQLVESEKLASLGRLVAGVAHELNTPLGNALMASSSLEEDLNRLQRLTEAGQLKRSDLLESLARGADGYSLVHRNVVRASEIVRGFKQLALDQTTDARRRFELHQVLGELLHTLQPSFRHTPFRLVEELEPGNAMDSYPGPLGQVVGNVVMNALLHGFEGRETGTVSVRCWALDASRVQVECRDDGHGMSEEVRERIFEPFFSTRFGQGGSGLGMHIVHNLVTGLLGGRIIVESAPGQGARILITLPRCAPDATAASVPLRSQESS